MKNDLHQMSSAFEPTGDELPQPVHPRFAMDRRKFFKQTAGGLAVAFVLHDLFAFAGKAGTAGEASLPVSQVGAWLHIDEQGKVTVYTGKVEVGQNIRTSLSQVVAEELVIPLEQVTLIMGDTDLVPYDAGTFGSRTTPQMGTQLRKAAASARQALLQMAATQWKADISALQVENGMVVHKTTRQKAGYGELTRGKQLLLAVSDGAQPISPQQWQVAGKTVPKIGGRSFITGKHVYVSDMKMPGMLFGKVLRPPSFNAVLLEADVDRAKAMPGVVVVHDGNFVGVAAPHVRTATRALQSIVAKWKETPGQPNDNNLFAHLLKEANTPGGNNNAASNTAQEFLQADHVLEATYNIHYIAHVPLEPRAAVAQWQEGKLTVWTGTQRPFGVQEQLTNVFKIGKEKVRVLVPDTGSGYGGKHTGEAAIEAARLAQEAGAPVKVVWTREEEFTWAYSRPGGVVQVKSGVKQDGTITGWSFTNYNSGGAGLGTPYRVAHPQVAHVSSKSPLSQGSYRGLATTANVFARESQMSDMARSIGMDQLQFRLINLDNERLITVLKRAATAFGWEKKPTAGRGFGIAAGFEKGGYVATCAEVAVNSAKEVKVLRAVQAFECGAIIHPWHLEHQVMGSIVQGIGGALFEVVRFANGKLLNPGLAAYRVPRFSDVPPIEVILIDRKDLPSAGAGEAAIIGIAPAIRNAIAAASGVQLTTLPMVPNGVLA